MAAENHQERLYNLLDQLQRMARELPTKYEYNILDIYQQLVSRYQQRIPYDLLAELAASLAQGQIFEIVKMLTEVCSAEIIFCKAMKKHACPLVQVQQATEKHLFQQRLQSINRQQQEKQTLVARNASEAEVMYNSTLELSRTQSISLIINGPESDHWECLSLTD